MKKVVKLFLLVITCLFMFSLTGCAKGSFKEAELVKVGDIHTREQNMAYTEVMVNQNGQIVDGADSSDLTEFANKTQMTAITPVRVVTLYHDNSRTANTNLGLIERPKVELQIKEEVESYKVTLADGRVIIDSTKTGMTQNVLDLNDMNKDTYNLLLEILK